jgi:hypothetical protein
LETVESFAVEQYWLFAKKRLTITADRNFHADFDALTAASATIVRKSNGNLQIFKS